MVELVLVEVRVNPPHDSPLVVLREAQGERHLAIWMSTAAASAVVSGLEEADPDTPTTHDLLCELTRALDHAVTAVEITGEQEGRFFAELEIDGHRIHARPSDAIALALRLGVPITSPEGLLQRIGYTVAPLEPDTSARPEDEVERFREFLESVDPQDF